MRAASALAGVVSRVVSPALDSTAQRVPAEGVRSPRCPEGLGRARSTYVRRQPEGTLLHQIVRQHLETFLAEARLRGSGDGLPQFVERELRKFLTCGDLTRGFAHFRCDDCGHEMLVAYSGSSRLIGKDPLTGMSRSRRSPL